MSQARRTADALTSALESVKTASSAAVQHRNRGEGQSFPQHITDLQNLVWAMGEVHAITRELAKVAKTCADDTRQRYFHGVRPDGGGAWPDEVKNTAAEADRALSKLRHSFTKVPTAAGHDALNHLLAFVRETKRNHAK